MNHGNWLCCHISNPPAQGLTAEYVTAGRSSLLKGCTAGYPGEGPVEGPDCPCRVTQLATVANGRRSLTLAGRNEDVLLKIPVQPSCPRLFSTLPTLHHHFSCVICLYQHTILMTSSLTRDHSSLTSSWILEEVLNNILGFWISVPHHICEAIKTDLRKENEHITLHPFPSTSICSTRFCTT